MDKPTFGSRALHWVLKVGNLKRSMAFFSDILGLRVLRHEEFSSGCEATCNGPYGGAWSKTMIGYGPEQTYFALELTYNYGVDSYASGNDLLYIALVCPSALSRARALGYEVIESESIVVGPDNYRFKILPEEAGKGRAERFSCVSLRVADLSAATDYWSNVLGLTVTAPLPDPDLDSPPSALVSFGSDQVGLQLVRSEPGVEVDHGLSSGRIAFGCPTSSVPGIFDMVTKSGGLVQTPPLTLPTPGKADVVVTILVDRDGYEICFVEDAAFYDLATPLYDVVDYEGRASRGGDGASLPALPPLHTAGTTSVTSEEQFRALAASPTVVIFEFGAAWCKKCKTLALHISKLAEENPSLPVFTVDIDELVDLSSELGVSAIPRIVVYRDGRIVDDYTGSAEAEVTALFDRLKN